MASPTISIIIPLHNAARWVEETLDSVARQTTPLGDFELIVVDDASSDDGAQLVARFLAARGLAGQIVRLATNVGVSVARNTGLRVARAPWIQFLDADDLLAPEKLELQLAATLSTASSADVLYSPWQHLRFESERWEPNGPVVCSEVDRDTVVRILDDWFFGYVGPTLIRREAALGVGGFSANVHLGEDFDLMLRLAMNGARFKQVPSASPLFFYRETPNSLWRRAAQTPGVMRDLVEIVSSAEIFLRSEGTELSPAARDALASRYERTLALLFEYDRAAYHTTLERIVKLGVVSAPGSSRSLRALSRVVGYRNAKTFAQNVRASREQILQSLKGFVRPPSARTPT